MYNKHREPSFFQYLYSYVPELAFNFYGAIFHHFTYQKQLEKGLRNLGITTKSYRIHHQFAHAYGGYITSKYDNCLVFTLDGYGSGCSGAVFKCNQDDIELIKTIPHPNSVGLIYGLTTYLLGFKPNRHEGKLVGLAAYGNPHIPSLYNSFYEKMWHTNGDIVIINPLDPFFIKKLLKYYTREDVVATLQLRIEEIVTDWIKHFIKETKISKVVLSGGVFANVKLNQRIIELPDTSKVFVYPPMPGLGTCIGSAFLCYKKSTGKTPIMEDHMYLGYSIQNNGHIFDDIYEISTDKPTKWIAEKIIDNKVIGVARNNMEFGPRALGNRSILANASNSILANKLNINLGRNDFMPFAPVVMEEDVELIFDTKHIDKCNYSLKFMTQSLLVKSEISSKIAAVIHIDNTSRIQIINRVDNSFLWEVLSYIKNSKGIGIALNTSFNMHEEPIICTQNDAISTYMKSDIDYLVLGEKIYGKRIPNQY